MLSEVPNHIGHGLLALASGGDEPTFDDTTDDDDDDDVHGGAGIGSTMYTPADYTGQYNPAPYSGAYDAHMYAEVYDNMHYKKMPAHLPSYQRSSPHITPSPNALYGVIR